MSDDTTEITTVEASESTQVASTSEAPLNDLSDVHIISASSSNDSIGHEPIVKVDDAVTSQTTDKTTTITAKKRMTDPPTSAPLDPSPSMMSHSRLSLPNNTSAGNNSAAEEDGAASLGGWSEWASIADASKKSSSRVTSATTTNHANNEYNEMENSQYVETNIPNDVEYNHSHYEKDEGDLPSLSGNRHYNSSSTTTTSTVEEPPEVHNSTTDPPEYGYKRTQKKKGGGGIHTMRMNSRGHVYLEDEESVANSTFAPPGLSSAARLGSSSSRTTNNNYNDGKESVNEATSSIEDGSYYSNDSPPPPSNYFSQPSQRIMYPAEPRGGTIDNVTGQYLVNTDEGSSVGGGGNESQNSSDVTSLASNTTRSSVAVTNDRGNSGTNNDDGEVSVELNMERNGKSALDRHLSTTSSKKSSSGNTTTKKGLDPRDKSDLRKKRDPQVWNGTDGQQQQQRVVYASTVKRDMYNHRPINSQQVDKAKDSDVETNGRGGSSSFQQQNQRVRFTDKIFSPSSKNRNTTSNSSTHQMVVGNTSSSQGLSWRERSISSDNSTTSKSSIDSSSSSSTTSSSRSRGGSGFKRGRGVVSLLKNVFMTVFEGLQPTSTSSAGNILPTTNTRTTTTTATSGATTRFKYLKRNMALLAIMSMMMMLTIGSYSDAFFGTAFTENGYENKRGLGVEHDMRPPAMGLMDNVPHHELLKGGGGGGGAGMTAAGGNTNIMGGGNGSLPPLVENGQVVDWDKVPPHLRGYYSKVFGAQVGNSGPQQQQQVMMQTAPMGGEQQVDSNVAAQAIQSIGNEAIGEIPTLGQDEFEQHIQEIEGVIPLLGKQPIEDGGVQQQPNEMEVKNEELEQQQQAIQSISNEAAEVPTLKQEEFEQHIEEIEGVVPLLGGQQQEQQQREEEQMQQQQQQQREDEEMRQQQQREEEQMQLQQQQVEQQVNEEELVKQRLEEVHQRQQAEAEQQRMQKEGKEVDQEGLKEMTLPSPEEMDAAREENVNRIAIEEEERRKQAEMEALNRGKAKEEVQQRPVETENKGPVKESEEEDPSATLESLESELSELMNKVKEKTGETG